MKKSTTFLFMLILTLNAFTQISTNEIPLSFKERFNKDDIPVIMMPALNYEIIEEEDSIDKVNGLPPRFGFDFDVDIDVENSGRWIDLPNKKGKLWQLEIYCPGALSINLLYDKFHIPEGGKFFIYTPDKNKKLGAFTSRNNKGNRIHPGDFATSLIFTERIILEYYAPSNSIEIPVISIANVVHGYKYIKGAKLFGDSGNCNVNINCNEGNNWQDEKTSVALIIVGGTRWCTGSLINNTQVDGAPFLLTANHCLSGLDAISNPNASTWTFLWNYESPTCVSGTDFTPPSTSGATVRANNSTSDFALLELDEAPFDLTPSLCMYYNGWDKSGSTTSNTTCIHHPSGDIKKISIDNDSPSSNGSYWRVNDWDTGTTEGGSSGSPLFDSNQRIIGQLYGGDAACGNDLYDDFGKLSVSWNNSTDSRRRLKDWLDPAGTNPNTLDGAYLFPTNNTTISGPSIVCSSGSTFSISNLPSVDSIIWETGSRLTVSSGQNTNSCTISATGSGSSWVSARLVNDCGSITLPQKTIWVGAPDLDNITVYYTDDLNQYGEYCPGETNELLARPAPSINMGITDNYWDLGNWNVYNEDGEGYVLFGIPTSFNGSEELSYEISNSCDIAIGTITLYEGNCGGYYMLISPNPGSGETTISLGSAENDGGTLKSA